MTFPGIARIPVQRFEQEKFGFSGQIRAVEGIQTVVGFVGQEWKITRKIGPRETDAGRVGTGK